MTYTVEQVVDVLEAADTGYSNWQWGVADLEYYGRTLDTAIGEVSFVDGYTGSEGGGEDVWMVFKVGDQYFRTTGYYASYDGTTWDGGTEEVEPFEKTVIDYRRV